MADPRAGAALEVSSLSARYGPVPALDSISLTIGRGEIVTIVGANGAGKSTLIRTICGLVTPVSGSVSLYGKDVTGFEPHLLVQAGMSVVPEGRRLFGDMTVRENLEMGAYTRSDQAAILKDFDRVLDLFPDLRDRLSERTANFSGGQQQMIAVARGLMSAPRLLMLDEPTIGLAPAIVDRIGETITRVARNGVDVLLVEQNAEVALAIADRAYVLEAGRIVNEGIAAELAASPDVQKAYLGI